MSWDIFGPAITIQLVGQLGQSVSYIGIKMVHISFLIFNLIFIIYLFFLNLAENDYMAFGLSGSMQKSEMLGADVAIAYLDGALGYATDYNITAKAPVSKSGGIFQFQTNSLYLIAYNLY